MSFTPTRAPKITKAVPGGLTSWTPDPEMKYCIAKLQAGGGSGGTVTSGGGTNGWMALPGGGGGYVEVMITKVQAGSAAISISAGVGGVAPGSQGVGQNGTNSVITGFATAIGGSGGSFVQSVTTTASSAGGNGGTGNGVSVGTSLFVMDGQRGCDSTASSSTLTNAPMVSGGGGDSFMGIAPKTNANCTGSVSVAAISSTGVGYGYGGGGRIGYGNAGTQQGLNGGDGIIIITEYF